MEQHSLNESIAHIEEISDTLVFFLGNILEITKTNKIQLVGIGNSISAGWTATNNNVAPWIKKLSPYIEQKCQKAGVDIELDAYSIASDNSNERIYEFLNANPSLDDVRNHFIRSFDSWKARFDGTLLENTVDKEPAIQFYNQGEKRLFDCYSDSYFTIASFNGCTGELLKSLPLLLHKNGLNSIFEKELYYLEQIIELILRLSANSYITVGNFPRISKKYLILINTIINKINEQIKGVVSEYERTMFFDKIVLNFFEKINGKLKLDNHPNLQQQYRALYQYIIYLMNNLPLYIMQKNNDYNIKHYIGLDYDGNLERRLKRFLS